MAGERDAWVGGGLTVKMTTRAAGQQAGRGQDAAGAKRRSGDPKGSSFFKELRSRE